MDSKEEVLFKAGILEELTTTKGWKFITTYIQDRIQQFTNKALIDGFKNMEEYMFYRGEVSGLRSLLVEVENSLQNLKNYRDEHKE